MKYLTLVRHAAAVHDSSFRDFDRPLREKGLKKIKFNTEELNRRGYLPDLLVSSPAARALETAHCYADGAGLSKKDIVLVDSLYLPSPGDILDCVREIQQGFSDVFLFSHNNGISWAAQQLCGNRSILMPTGSVVRIEFDVNDWNDIYFGAGRLADFLP